MREKICKISLFTAILASLSTLPVDARVNVNNSSRSYAGAYNQVNAMRYQQEYMDANAINVSTASATDNLPVAVQDERLASEILNNTSKTTLSELDACAMIWPNGVFQWAIPESGIRREPTNQCVAVISLVDATTEQVLATTTMAAGDTMKCNIDSFPESRMNRSLVEKTVLPADAAPTMEDVEAVMNEEQKQNAGLKIAAGAIISGLAGNLLAKKEAGDTKLLGTTKTRWVDTAIGAATGASVMAASSYSGKVAGDTIKSTAVNAASGMIVGNMLAGATGGDSFLEIQKCNITEDSGEFKGEHDCISGKIETKGDQVCSGKDTIDGKCDSENENIVYIINEKRDAQKCDKGEQDKIQNCTSIGKLIDVWISAKNSEGGSTSFDSLFGSDRKTSEFENHERYYQNPEDPVGVFTRYTDTQKDNTYYKVQKAYKSGKSQRAYIVFKSDIQKNIKGHKKSELETLKGAETDYAYFARNASGSVGAQITANKTDVYFDASSRDAEDGGLIDISNQARVKGTLVGTAAGGALGGFAGYQGAKTEITDRWTSAVREYEDSLSNFACMCGSRYLSKYNDNVDVPELKKPEQ